MQPFRVPATFKELLLYIIAGWLGAVVFAVVLSLFSIYTAIGGLLLFLSATGAAVQQIWALLRARQRVLVDKDVPLLWGLVRLMAWDPVEGVLFLQNKRLAFSDDDLHDGHGGVRFVYPILGEELALRVPLEVQTLRFADEKVLTREYLSVTVRGTMKWRIVDIRRFYLLVSRELRSTLDHGGQTRQSRLMASSPTTSGLPISATNAGEMMTLAIEWLRVLAEEQTRTVVSRVSSGLLMADRLSSEISEASAQRSERALPSSQSAPSEWTGAADGLARAIYDTIAARVTAYGISVDEVSLQEIRLPEEIVQQCIEACKAAYLPLLAQREASRKRADLAAEVDLLGRELVGTREVVGAAPGFSLVDFVGKFLNQKLADPAGIGLAAATTTAAVLALPPQATPPETAVAKTP
jgi:regulator of protease activity HflC (stomatin/prohibitin superfamily)